MAGPEGSDPAVPGVLRVCRMECEFGEREARGCVSAHEWRCETHVCTWDCQVEHVIGNMFRCLSTGHVHICDCNCRNRVDYGPNEEICFVSRRV